MQSSNSEVRSNSYKIEMYVQTIDLHIIYENGIYEFYKTEFTELPVYIKHIYTWKHTKNRESDLAFA